MVVRPKPAVGAAGRRLSRAPWVPDAVGAGLIVAALIAWWAKVEHLFPQVEFVDWINQPAGATVRAGVTAIWHFTDDGGFSRHVSMMYSAGLGRVCGTGIVCLNTLAFLPVAATALLAYALGRALALPAAAAVGVVAVLLISEPTFSVLTWQATMHDRLAGAFALSTMLLVLVMVRRARLTLAFAVPWAVGLSVLCLAAVNTKEPAWALLGAVAGAPLLLAPDRRRAIASAAILAAPLVVMLVHVATDLHALNSDSTSHEHVSGGSPSDNIRILTTYAVPGGVGVFAALAVVAAAGCALGVLARRERPEAYLAARRAAWIGGAAVIGWIIPLRTASPAPFYMFVPLTTAALAVTLALRAALLAVAGRVGAPAVARIAGAAAGIVLVAWFAGGAALNRWDLYGHWLQMDRSFRAGVDDLAAFRRAHPDAMFQFAAPPAAPFAYRWVTANPAADFWRLSHAATPIDRVVAISTQPLPCGDRRTFVVNLDANMHIGRICPRG